MKSLNINHQNTTLRRKDRENIKDQKAFVVWLTGLSGSGKSTLANALEIRLHKLNKHTCILDGDNLRMGINKDLRFNKEDRKENIRRVAEIAKLMIDAGLIVITAFISPFRDDRKMARRLIGPKNFIEVYIDTPLEICEARDSKGLYDKARKGFVVNMTGIDSPYEKPLDPDLNLKGTSSLDFNVEKVIDHILKKF